MELVPPTTWTELQHLGEDYKDKPYGAVVPPIYQNSLFVFPSLDHWRGTHGVPVEKSPYVYSRISNPTTDLAEAKIALIEGAEGCLLTTSGMAAISAAILHALRTTGRKHVVCIDTAYGPTREFLTRYCEPLGVTVDYVSGLCVDEIREKLSESTALMYLESPSSVFMRLQDISEIVNLCKPLGIVTVIDSTYNAGILCQPLSLGIDLVVHSVTKYFGGHSDVVAGAICGNAARIQQIADDEIQFLGALLPPFPSWLVNRGIRTLPMRFQRSAETAQTVAEWLADNSKIQSVLHVGMVQDAEQTRLYKQYMKGSGGLFSFEPKNQDQTAIDKVINSLKLFQIGVSWGGHESLATTHNSQPSGYDKPINLVRLYCGFEDAGDLIRDLEQASKDL